MNTIPFDPTGNLLIYSGSAILINILTAFAVGIILSLVYRSTHHGLSYSQSFSQTIVFVSVIVAIVMMVVAGSLVRAFALVGAMSIIRFRTVLKDTKDMAYVFGALGLGMAAGTGNYFLAALGTTAVCLVAVLLWKLNFGSISKSEFILRFRFLQECDSEAYVQALNNLCRSSKLLHMEPSGDNRSLNLTYDINLKSDEKAQELTRQFGSIEGVSEVLVVSSRDDVDY